MRDPAARRVANFGISLPLTETHIAKINAFIERVSLLFESNITVRDHMRARWVDATFATPTGSDPIAVAVPLASAPMGVFLAGCWDQNGAPLSFASTLAWSYVNGSVEMPNLSGIPSTGGTVRIRLLVLEA